MPTVRYKSGAKLSGALYLNGKLPIDIGKFNGSDWESSVFHLELTIPASNLDFAIDTTANNFNLTKVIENEPWVWTQNDNSSYAYIWGDGTIERGVGGTTTHSYSSDGVYNFYQIGGRHRSFTPNTSVTSIKNFGGQYGSTYGGPYIFPNATYESTTHPVFMNGPRFLTCGLADFDATNYLDGMRNSGPWLGHTGSSLFYGLSVFNNAGVGGVGVGIDTWEFPGQYEILASGTVDSLVTNQLVDSTAAFTTDIPYQHSVVVRNTDTGATAFNSWQSRTATTLTLTNTSNAPRAAIPLVNKDIFTAVGQSYEIVHAWAGNSNFGGIFNGWSSFNQYIGSWRLEGFIDCFGGFGGWNSFNNGDAPGVAGGGVGQGMDNWYVADTVSLDGLPISGPDFNQYIGSWNVGNNQKFTNFFRDGTNFNQPLNSWNVGEHLSPGQNLLCDLMFDGSGFDQEISSWDMSKATTLRRMLSNCPFNNGGVGGSGVGIDTWDTSNVGDISQIFLNNSTFNHSIGSWNVGKVTNARGMFENSFSFNSAATLGNWGANLTADQTISFYGLFDNARAFNQDIGSWTTGKVTSMYTMFVGATNFNNGGVGGVGAGMDQWDVSSCTNFGFMFSDATSFNQYIGSWTFTTGDVSAGTTTSVVTNQIVDSSADFIADGVETGQSIINNVAKKIATVTLPPILYNGYRNNNPTAFKLIDTASNVDYISSGILAGAFVKNTATGATANVVSVDSAQQLTLTADIFPINNERYYIQPVHYLTLNSDIFQNSGESYSVFKSINGSHMFKSAASFSADLSNWNTQNFTNMENMFAGTPSTSTNFSQWDVSRCTTLYGMFYNTTSINPDVTNWDVSAVTNTSSMFYNSGNVTGNFSGWDTRSLISVTSMFRFSTFDGDISSWNIQNLTSAGNFLTGSMSTANYDSLLIGWSSQAPNIQSNVNLDIGTTQYTAGGAAESGRTLLTGTYGWTITDGGPV